MYKRIHRAMFGRGGSDGTVFSKGPPEFLIMPLIGAILLGAGAAITGIIDMF